MIAMIDRALLYKESFVEFSIKSPNEINPFEQYKCADKFLGWRNLCVWFTGLFNILNSTKNRLDTIDYIDNLIFLKDFLKWFELWKLECLERQLLKLPESANGYQKMCGFFSAEATDDCVTMVKSIIQMTEYYCKKSSEGSKPKYFLPRRISQDLVENSFSRIRLAIGHGRLDHRTTAAACAKVNLIKEVNTSDRNRKKRNASGCIVESKTSIDNENLTCTEYPKLRMDEARFRKNLIFYAINPFEWIKTDGVLHLRLTKK